MDNKTKAKYLGMLVQTVMRVDDSQFSQRVNSEKHDYADWIVKNMKDEELAKQIKPITTKQGVVDFLNKTIGELNAESPAAPAAVSEPEKEKTVPTKPAMDGTSKAKYLNMLLQTVMRVDDNTFKSRVSEGKHDYADWIMKNMKDEELSVELRRITDKQGLLEFIHYKIGEWSPELAKTIKLPEREIIEAKPIPAGVDEIIPPKPELTKPEIKPEEAKGPEPLEMRQPAPEEEIKKPGLEVKEDNKEEIQKPAPITTKEITEEKKGDIEKPEPIVAEEKKEEITKPEPIIAEPEKEELKTVDEPEEEKIEEPPATPLHPALQEIHEDYHFVLPNGNKIASLPQLAELLPDMDMVHFNSHVTDYKNDFAAWIHHTVKDEELARQIGSVKDKKEMADIIISRVRQHESTPFVMSPLKPQPIAPPTTKDDPEPKAMPTPPEKTKMMPPPQMQVPRPSAQAIKPIQKMMAAQASNTTVDMDLWKLSPRDLLKKLGLVNDATQFLALEEELKEEKKKRKCVKTGVPGFDDMIGDGIPINSTILMSGGPGSGKTTFCIQMLGWAAERGEKCLFMTFEETEDNLIEHMEAYGLNPREYIANGTLMIQRQDPFKISRMVEALLAHARGELLINIDEIIDILPRGFKPDRIVVDSLSAIASAFSESNTAYRIYVTKLIDILQKTGATSFLITEVQGIEHIGHGLVEEFLADGVVVFYNLQKGNIKQSALEILKMRAVNHEKKIVPFEFVENKGIVVYPLERTFI